MRKMHGGRENKEIRNIHSFRLTKKNLKRSNYNSTCQNYGVILSSCENITKSRSFSPSTFGNVFTGAYNDSIILTCRIEI